MLFVDLIYVRHAMLTRLPILDSTAAATCASYPSKVSISDVHYINVTGTSSGAEKQLVADLVCSATCYNITASGTHLSPPSGAPMYTCKNIANLSAVRFLSHRAAIFTKHDSRSISLARRENIFVHLFETSRCSVPHALFTRLLLIRANTTHDQSNLCMMYDICSDVIQLKIDIIIL
jgi:hypothetical protein